MKNVELLKSSGVDVNHGLELLGDMETYDEILEEFLNGYDERIASMKEYKDSNDMPNYAILVHALKSDSKYLGFMTLAELAYQHEMESKANNTSFINEHYNELMEEASRIINLVHQYLGK
jgi:HPt (histidine-containing phosphotransfer) domain-containing protein